MNDEFDRLIDDLKRQRTTVEKHFDDTAASQTRTDDILRKLEELRRRAGITDRSEVEPKR